MEDNVVQMPTPIDRLMTAVSNDYMLMLTSDTNWKASAYDFCLHLLQVREQFPDNIKFNKALDDGGIDLSHHNRAAAIAMARDPVRLKQVLDATERRSLQTIYYEEYRVTNPSKTIDTSKAKLKVTPPTQKAMDAIQKLRDKGVKITQKTVAKEAGVSETSVRRAFTIEQAVAAAGASVPAPEPVIDPTSFSMTAQQKLETYKRQLEKAVDERVHGLAQEMLKKIFENHYNALDKRIKEVMYLLRRKFPFSRPEFKKLMMAVHPDNSASKEMRDEVFRIINEREVILQPDVETELADKAAKARLADLDRSMREANAWLAANPGKKKWPGPGAK